MPRPVSLNCSCCVQCSAADRPIFTSSILLFFLFLHGDCSKAGSQILALLSLTWWSWLAPFLMSDFPNLLFLSTTFLKKSTLRMPHFSGVHLQTRERSVFFFILIYHSAVDGIPPFVQQVVRLSVELADLCCMTPLRSVGTLCPVGGFTACFVCSLSTGCYEDLDLKGGGFSLRSSQLTTMAEVSCCILTVTA